MPKKSVTLSYIESGHKFEELKNVNAQESRLKEPSISIFDVDNKSSYGKLSDPLTNNIFKTATKTRFEK